MSLQFLLVCNNDLLVFISYYIRRNPILIMYLNGKYFKIPIILKYTPLHTHAISNHIQEIFPVGVFVEGHHFSEINVRGVILY